MTPRHHPSAVIQAAYASGTLEPGFGLVVGAHVRMCVACRGQVHAYESASGQALEELPPVELSSDALVRTLARLDRSDPISDPSADDPFLDQLSLRPKRWVAPGVWVAAVDTPHAQQNRVYVLSVRGGLTSARHGHTGAEFCTVLQGAYRDHSETFAVGDFAAAHPECDHQSIVLGEERCICLFATEGRLLPKGFLGRIAFALADV